MKLITRLVSSLVKIFPDDINGECISCATALKNEPFSFQVAFKCDDYWVYYMGNQLKCGCSNRIIQTPSSRNRVLGLQMYVKDAKGFLHWGYNYYYDIISQGFFNPMINPCGYNQLAGTSYIVYPDIRGFAVPSLRMKVQYEGFNDYRALQKLESLIAREETLKFVEKTIGKVDYKFCPTGKELFEFRQKLNEEIKKHI